MLLKVAPNPRSESRLVADICPKFDVSSVFHCNPYPSGVPCARVSRKGAAGAIAFATVSLGRARYRRQAA